MLARTSSFFLLLLSFVAEELRAGLMVEACVHTEARVQHVLRDEKGVSYGGKGVTSSSIWIVASIRVRLQTSLCPKECGYID